MVRPSRAESAARVSRADLDSLCLSRPGVRVLRDPSLFANLRLGERLNPPFSPREPWLTPRDSTPAQAVGLSSANGSALLACVNGACVLSRVAMGVLSDKHSPHRLGFGTMLASSVAVLVLWGVACALAVLSLAVHDEHCTDSRDPT